jgi:uncharacterized protein
MRIFYCVPFLSKLAYAVVPILSYTLDALRGRLRETQTFLKKLPVNGFSNAGNRTYYLSEPLIDGWLCASDYILDLILPDFFFHVATAHAILRHLGPSVGKRDFLGPFDIRSNGYS